MQVTYPGVYIEEIPSGVTPIAGVATSITAFMGTALMGPLGYDKATLEVRPITIFSFQDYQRIFGGLWSNSPMSYAVRDFFLNGGSQAVIVRLFEPKPSASPDPSPGSSASSSPGSSPVPSLNDGKAVIHVDPPSSPPITPPTTASFVPAKPLVTSSLTLLAANPGSWGNNLRVMADVTNITEEDSDRWSSHGVTRGQLFNLTILYHPPDRPWQTERFTNLSVQDNPNNPNPNRLDRVLNEQSQLVQVNPTTMPPILDPNWTNEWSAFSSSLTNYNPEQTYQMLKPAAGGDDGQPYLLTSTYVDDGTKALDRVDLFNLLCIPYDTNAPDALEAETQAMNAYPELARYCQKRRAMLIVDPPQSWTIAARNDQWESIQPTDLKIDGEVDLNAAVYFPRVIEADPTNNDLPRVMPPCGLIAGVIASTDSSRGVWKAPAGLDAGILGILNLEVNLTDNQNGVLNPVAINCLRTFPVTGSVVWGARTLRGADIIADYKYIAVRRLALYIEESVCRGSKWAVFQPNAEPLWASLRLAVSTFLEELQRQGAFFSYFVNCDKTTTSPDDIANGVVNIAIGIAPVAPAEFIVIQIQQAAAQTN